jgi:hypothetical protein
MKLMDDQTETSKARCSYCRSDVSVPAAYTQGDHIKCGSCGTKHKVVRGEVLRLVLADVTPLQEALRANELHLDRLEAELAHARGSFGIGANGFGIAVIFLLWKVTYGGESWTSDLLWSAVAVAVGSGLLLELANYSFLAKRRAMSRVSLEIDTAQAESVRLKQKIREAGRI